MVQKDKFRAENSFQKLILTLLIIFTVPLPARSEIKIPSRKNCSLIKKKQSYDYYDRQEAHDFGRKIQTLIAKKDIQGIYKNVLIDELQNGPRREFIKNKSFDQIFPKKWVTKVISTEIDCDSIGWRGFMISNGLIWFDRMESGKWTIKSINGVRQEQFDNKNLFGWKTNKGIIPPTCFPTFGNFEKPKVDLFTEEFGIKNKTKFEYSPGEYIGKTYFIKKNKEKFNAKIRITPTFANGKDQAQTGYCGVTEVIDEEVNVPINFSTKLRMCASSLRAGIKAVTSIELQFDFSGVFSILSSVAHGLKGTKRYPSQNSKQIDVNMSTLKRLRQPCSCYSL